MPRSLPRALALTVALLAAFATTATAATVRTDATPAQIRAGKKTYDKAIAAGFAQATRHLDRQLAKHPKKPTVVLDIDETTMSNWGCFDAVDFDLGALATCIVENRSAAFPAAKTFIKHARARKVRIAFITGAPQIVCASRRKNLRAQGITVPFTLVCRPADDHRDTLVPFKSGERKKLEKAGATILVNVGDQKSDLAGGAARTKVLLPNPIYRTA